MLNLRFIKALKILTLVFLSGNWTLAQSGKLPEPDLANVQYGTHERNLFDIWFADTTNTTPLAIYIHGGGFVSGSKENIKAM